MGKFKYSMQNILDIKIKLETQAKNEFSEANRAYLIEKEKLEELFKKRAVYEAALKEQLSGSLNISEINIYYNHYISSAFAYFADCRTYSQYISDSYVNSGADTYICAKNNCNFSCDDALWLMDARHYVRIYD